MTFQDQTANNNIDEESIFNANESEINLSTSIDSVMDKLNNYDTLLNQKLGSIFGITQSIQEFPTKIWEN